ncbi:MAG: LysM peptidoglycan-binding domain-containing protein [Candidatus Moranbacteria bacterium]|nr:LysM peptidoglycan-binding domain-containing protein [Candidatus Moranbacteria bacterium]NTW45929.1 LysM peptidoglycan-binding domain-containing protein [Candidatus Moranbacteria bacterium]
MHRLQRETLDFVKSGRVGGLVRAFRAYGPFLLVAASALFVSLTNVAHERGTSPIFGYFRTADVSAAPTGTRKRFAEVEGRGESLSMAPLSVPSVPLDLSERTSGEEAAFFQDGALLSAQSGNSIMKDPEEDGGLTIYTVRNGDTVSGIAAAHGITVNTILWANDLDNVDSIKPGDQIFLLPVAGLSHTVAAGDSIDSIAAKYKADREKIIAYNGLPANGEVEVGTSIVIPGGFKELPRQEETAGLARRQYASSSSAGEVTDVSGGYRKLDGKAGSGHRFPYGYCTWYVAQKRYVPWGGNAGTWLFNARSMGYRTGKTPTRGAIVVTTENRYYGHVAIVESVSAGSITVSEMNYRGWGKVDRRVIPTSSRVIKGYIY